MKPLYLESQKGIRVFLDGPALLVRCAKNAILYLYIIFEVLCIPFG